MARLEWEVRLVKRAGRKAKRYESLVRLALIWRQDLRVSVISRK